MFSSSFSSADPELFKGIPRIETVMFHIIEVLKGHGRISAVTCPAPI